MFENSIIWAVETYKVLSAKETGDVQPLNQKKMKKKWVIKIVFVKFYRILFYTKFQLREENFNKFCLHKDKKRSLLYDIFSNKSILSYLAHRGQKDA